MLPSDEKIQQIAASLPHGIRYEELNLAECTESEFRSGLTSLNGTTASLCLVDEVDAKPQESWPYEMLLPYLDAAVDRGARFVFVLAGSSGASIDELKQGIGSAPQGGADLLSRILIPPPNLTPVESPSVRRITIRSCSFRPLWRVEKSAAHRRLSCCRKACWRGGHASGYRSDAR